MGVLMEKSIITPDQYPLSLHSLTVGCNQSTSRDPITELVDIEVEESLTLLRDRKLVSRVDQAGARVPKFQHRLLDEWTMTIPELAVLTVLMLRGPQTAGQLRQRTERMYLFRDVDEVRETLDALISREVEPEHLAVKLPLLPGSKEARYAHTLSSVSEVSLSPMEDHHCAPAHLEDSAVVQASLPGLRTRVEQLESALEHLRQEFEDFKSQF